MLVLNEAQAIELFCQAATTQALATESGDYQLSNTSYQRMANALRWLKVNSVTHLLSPLLSAPEIGPRLWAASYLLQEQPIAAEETLKALATRSDIHGFTAATTLREWQAGRMTSLI